MVEPHPDSSCMFCAKFSDTASTSREWFDTELTGTDDFLVVPGLGALVEGYLLIVTKEHYHSMAQLPIAKLHKLEALKTKVREVLDRDYGPSVVFEHGAVSPSGGAGSCIVHAHFHILPLANDLLVALKEDGHVMEPIHSLVGLVEFATIGKPYLFFEDQGGTMYVCGTDENLPGQYIRRLIAAQLGISGEWDYAAFPNYEKIDSTLKKLTPWPTA